MAVIGGACVLAGFGSQPSILGTAIEFPEDILGILLVSGMMLLAGIVGLVMLIFGLLMMFLPDTAARLGYINPRNWKLELADRGEE